MRDEAVEFGERCLLSRRTVEPLASGELPFRVLGIESFCATAEFGFGAALVQEIEFFARMDIVWKLGNVRMLRNDRDLHAGCRGSALCEDVDFVHIRRARMLASMRADRLRSFCWGLLLVRRSGCTHAASPASFLATRRDQRTAMLPGGTLAPSDIQRRYRAGTRQRGRTDDTLSALRRSRNRRYDIQVSKRSTSRVRDSTLHAWRPMRTNRHEDCDYVMDIRDHRRYDIQVTKLPSAYYKDGSRQTDSTATFRPFMGTRLRISHAARCTIWATALRRPSILCPRHSLHITVSL